MASESLRYRYSLRSVEYHSEEFELTPEQAATAFTDPHHPTAEEIATVRSHLQTEPGQFWHYADPCGSEVMTEPGPELLTPPN